MKRQPKDTTHVDNKHKALLESYFEVISKYGEAARYISKDRLYAEAGEKVFLTPVYSGRIIRKLLKEKVK